MVPAFGAWPDVAQLVAKDWETVGIKTIVQIRERALHFSMRAANQLMTEIWNEDTTGFPFTGGAKFDLRNSPVQTLTYGPLYYRWLVSGGKEGVEPPASVVSPTYYTAAQSDARYQLSVDLTSINSAISTLNSEMTAVTATANAALPRAGGTMTGALTLTGLSGVLKAPAGVVSGNATTTDLTEGSNLYWTQARFNTALAAVSGVATALSFQ